MKIGNNQCYWITKSLHRCGRNGNWRFFCPGHVRPFFVAMMIGALGLIGLAADAKELADYLPSFFEVKKEEIIKQSTIREVLKQAEVEGLDYRVASPSIMMAKVFVRPILNDGLEVFNEVMVVNVSPIRALDRNYNFDPGDCRASAKVRSFDVGKMRAIVDLYRMTCIDNSSQIYKYNKPNDIPIGYLSSSDKVAQGWVTAVRENEKYFTFPIGADVVVEFQPPIQHLEHDGVSAIGRW